MWVLGIDAAGAQLSVALGSFTNSQSAKIHTEVAERQESHHEEVLSLTTKLFLKAEIKAQDVQHVVVSAGPGSFTGLRIALAFAKGFAQTRNIPLSLVPSFSAAAWSYRTQGKRILVASDARRDEYFSAYFPDTEAWKVSVPAQIRTKTELTALVEPHLSTLLLIDDGSLGWLAVPQRYGLTNQAQCLLLYWFENKSDVQTAAPADLVGFSELAPDYLRAVAAKTIQERQAQ